jgi:rhodanese-related sulfurtransferase
MTETHALARGLGAMAAVLGALAFVVGAPARSPGSVGAAVFSAATRDALDDRPRDDASGASASAVQSISALKLAEWIRDARPGLRVLDIRDSSAFATRHIPSAESLELMELSSVPPTPGETLVLYSDDDLLDLQGAAWLTRTGHARVHLVRGGMSAWMTEVIDPVVQGDSATVVAALSRYFGGVPRAPSPSDTASGPRTQTRVRSDFGFVARRGC